MTSQSALERSNWLFDDGEVGRILAARDWSIHALGPPDGWPAGLGIALQIGLTSRQPLLVWWGEDLHQFHNDACLAMLGGWHPACLAVNAPEVWPDQWETLGPPLRAALAGQRTSAIARVQSDRPIHLTCTPLLGEGGRVDGVLGVCRAEDVTFHAADPTEKQLQAELRDSEARYRTLIELSPQLLWIARPDGGFTFCNRHWIEYTGLSTAQSAERGWIAAVDPSHRSRVLEAWLQATGAGAALDMEIAFRRAADGECRWHLARAQPVRDSQGNIIHWMGIALDIHDRRQAVAALEDADRRKDEFLATLAHELRNPLAPLRNALYLLQLREHRAEAQPIHDIMHRQVRQMARLVDDLLDVSRVTRGRIGLQRSIVELGSVIDAAVEASRPLLDAARHTFTVTLPEAPVYVDGDPTRLAQVFTNLLNNAAKFTDPGGRIWLAAARNGNELVATVGDSGIGIPVHLLGEVFEIFRQLEHPLEHARGGLGIGLTLVKRLVQMHGGSVEAYSEGVGLGSRFVVRLPLAQAPSNDCPPVPEARSGRGAAGPVRRILVVDDNVDSAQSLALLLRWRGHDVQVAHDGESGLSAALRHQPNLVFLDIGLPGISGHEVAQRLRSRYSPSQMRLVAMTGYGQANDRLRSSSAGFDQHLVKPVEWPAIEATLTTLEA